MLVENRVYLKTYKAQKALNVEILQCWKDNVPDCAGKCCFCNTVHDTVSY